MKCPKCGEELTENVRFCPSCGTAVNQSLDKNTGINPLIPYIVFNCLELEAIEN
ncbi:zinc-ribbon domain-containing protein [Oribacterium sp. KHPX15]|uniref:zinc-ribbon domain-containing protein n=1 Tax=Oribacterium sp. KHPX15 TaxID=1855342 RepID=UPI000B88549A